MWLCLGIGNTYLRNDLSPNTRQKVRRLLKRVDEAGEFRISHADANTVRRDLKLLLDFWAAKWGEQKGERMADIVKALFIMLLRCFESGALFSPVLWKGDRPLGALACLADKAKGRLLFRCAGRDETFTSPPPGIILHAYTIRHAIRQGFNTYDFLRGNEPYKYMFGARDHRVRCFVVSTRNGRNLGGTLDRGSLGQALRGAVVLHQAGRLGEAEQGYRQVLEADPHCTAALFCLGQLVAARGSHNAAVETFRLLVALRPHSPKAWFRMGKSLRAQGDFDGAVLVRGRRAVELEPNYRDALAFMSEIPGPGALVDVGAQMVMKGVRATETGLPRDWGCGGGQGMTGRVFGWLGIKDGVGFAPGGNRGRWVEPKRRRDGDRPPR